MMLAAPAFAVTLGESAPAMPGIDRLILADHTGHAEVTLGDLVLQGAFARATLPNAPVAGGFLSIVNNGSADDRLIAVTSPISAMSQIHEMVMEGDVMQMRELADGLPLPAGQEVVLEPGGYHLMFMDLTGPLVEGEKLPVTLTFEKAGSVEIILDILGPGAKGTH